MHHRKSRVEIMETVSQTQPEISDYADKRLREGADSVTVQKELQSRWSNVVSDGGTAQSYVVFAQHRISSAPNPRMAAKGKEGK